VPRPPSLPPRPPACPRAAAGARRRLIGELASCPTLYCEWLWSGAFAAAVAAAYLGGTNRADLADVVAATLAEFAHVIAGVGITGGWTPAPFRRGFARCVGGV
jgi:hypothetical protein